MERHSSNAIFVSEIPVRCASSSDNDDKTIKWIRNLNQRTTARDVIESVITTCDPTKYSLYIHTDRKKLVLNDTSRIYKVIGKINQEKCSRRLLFEIRSKKSVKKHVRFADEIIIQNIVQRQCLPNERIRNNLIETLSNHRENFQQQKYAKVPSVYKRSSLRVIHENIPRSSSESGISLNLSTDDLIVSTKKILETLV